MKIGINLLPLRPGKMGGMEIYVMNLLLKLSTIDDDNEYYLITAPYNDATIHLPNAKCKKIAFHDEVTVSEKMKNLVHTIFGKISCPDSILKKIISQ